MPHYLASSATVTRRRFLKQTAAGLGVATVASAAPSILRGSPADRIRVAVMGVNSRGDAVAKSFALMKDCEVAFITDVDERAVQKTIETVRGVTGKAPQGVKDFRTLLDGDRIDALVIAAPDHWHAPATLLALQAGKHVYVEKPCGHNPREGEMLVEAQRRYGKLVQMGTQQRSSRETMQARQDIQDGLIGRPYMARTWYANTRGDIGVGRVEPPPGHLDWELWQGPAPRQPYRDNVVHYNWHWFWNWGTGEACNNGTHEVDVARWLLDVDYPVRTASNGGRYHLTGDWETPDTQTIAFDFPEGKTITWEGRSSNGFLIHNRGRGTAIHGSEGTLIIDRDGYELYDLKNKLVKEQKVNNSADALNTQGADLLTDLHIRNFLDAVAGNAPLNQPIEEGHKSTLLCHLGNIAIRAGRSLQTDPATGRILNDPQAQALWSREYAPGWEMAV